MNDLRRREFLKIAALGAAGAALPGMGPDLRVLFAGDEPAASGAPPAPRKGARPVLVVVFQRGGMDALNALVPYGDKRYASFRPTIALPSKSGAAEEGVIPLDDTFGLHPALGALKGFWDARQFAPIVNVGSPDATRSHFDAQDFMEYGAPGMRSVKCGWLNRYLSGTKAKREPRAHGELELRGLAMQGLLPRSLRGDVPVLAVPEKNVLNNEKVLDTFEGLYGPEAGGGMDDGSRPADPVVAAGRDTLETLERYKALVAANRKGRKVKYPSNKYAAKLQDLAGAIHADAGLEVACLDVGGWDHHANEGGDTGTLATMLKELGDSLAAFARDLGPLLDGTLILTMTEFGRTCRENGNSGTDHGHGGVMFLLGGGLQGGKVHGEWAGLGDKALYQGRDLPVTTDFRDVMATVLRRHMKFDLPKDFFPKYAPREVKGLF